MKPAKINHKKPGNKEGRIHQKKAGVSKIPFGDNATVVREACNKWLKKRGLLNEDGQNNWLFEKAVK